MQFLKETAISIKALPPPAGGRIAVAGDWHGNTLHAKTVIAMIAELGVDTIVHVGDLGILWPGDTGNSFTVNLQRELDRYGVRLFLTDGNHDAHPALRALPLDDAGFGVVRTKAKGGRRLELIRWAPRGHRWTWPSTDGPLVRFGALGGAYSVDWRHRKQGLSWWAVDEEVARADVERLGTDPLDVLISHELPAGPVPATSMRIPSTDEARSRVSRDLLRLAVDATRPALHFCGHWHQRRTFQIEHPHGAVTAVHLLDMDGSSSNWVVLELKTLLVHEQATVRRRLPG